jgi:hypothetical protein
MDICPYAVGAVTLSYHKCPASHFPTGASCGVQTLEGSDGSLLKQTTGFSVAVLAVCGLHDSREPKIMAFGCERMIELNN